MASKRDLVEAHGFNRKRLVSAFVSGAPQGRDVESVSRSRPVVAGLAVAGLLLGGSAIAGVLTSPLQDGWQDAHVVIGKQSAAALPWMAGGFCTAEAREKVAAFFAHFFLHPTSQ